MRSNFKIIFSIFILFLVSISLVSSESETYLELVIGECASVDLNEDEIPEVIICYNEDETISIDDVIAVDEAIEYSESETPLIFPSTTTIRKYDLPFDEDELKNEIFKQYSLVIYSLGGVIIVCLFLIGILFNKIGSKNNKKRK